MKINKIVLSVIMCIAILLAIPIVSKASNDTLSFNVTVTNDYTSAYEVLDIVNKERKAEGLNELQMDQELLDAAMIRASELVLNFSHTRPNGTSCFSIESKAYGENIAAGYGTPEYVMQGWMESSGHKANILRSNFTTIGIGSIKYGSLRYWVQLFGISEPNTVSLKPSNKEITRSIDMLSSYVQLYYNSMKEIFIGDYKNGYETKIVVPNPGWTGRCFTVDPKDLILESSDKTVFTVDDKGVLKFKSAGKAYLTAKLKQSTDVNIKQEINAVVRMYELKVDEIKDQVYTGKSIEPKVTIKDGNYILVKNKDYKITYTNNKKMRKSNS